MRATVITCLILCIVSLSLAAEQEEAKVKLRVGYAQTPEEAIAELEEFKGSYGDLAGWEGDRRVWSVRDGAITGRTTPDTRVTENQFLIWKDEVEDFELRLKFRLDGGNSGIYYRARRRPAGQTGGEPLVGAQADFSADGRWTGVIMEYTLRGLLAERGEKAVIGPDGRREVVG